MIFDLFSTAKDERSQSFPTLTEDGGVEAARRLLSGAEEQRRRRATRGRESGNPGGGRGAEAVLGFLDQGVPRRQKDVANLKNLKVEHFNRDRPL